MPNELSYMKKYLSKNAAKLYLSIVFVVLLSLISIIPPYLMKIVVDEGIVKKNMSSLITNCLIIAAIYIVSSALSYYSNFIFTVLSQNIILDIKKDVMNRIIRMPLSFFTVQDKGYILARVREIGQISSFFSSTTFNIIVSVFQFVGSVIILLYINIKLTAVMLLFLPVYFFLTKKMIGKVQQITRETMEETAKASGKLQETINGIEEIKKLNKELREQKKTDKINELLTKLSVRQGILLNFTTELFNLLGLIMSVIVLLLSGIQIIKDNYTLGLYFAFAGYLPKLLAPVQSFSMTSVTLQPGLLALRRVGEFFKVYTEEEKDEGKLMVNNIYGDIEVSDLAFKYPNEEKTVFENLNLMIKRGDKILLKGPNGSGKSTLLKLLMGFYDAYDGTILIDGKDIRDISKTSLRNRIGIVSQNIFLFNGTIKDNITYSVEEASDEDLHKAISLSGLKAVCERLPMGLLTNIGENGSLLSGGERQMLAIARAIIKNPDIIIFDEATTNVDVHNREIIGKMVGDLFREKTCIFVTHDENVQYPVNKTLNLNAALEDNLLQG